MAAFITLGFVLWFGWMFIEHRLAVGRELGRFSDQPFDLMSQLRQQFQVLAVGLGARKKRKQSVKYIAAKAERDMARKLSCAGLESAAEQGRFFLLRILCFVLGPALGVSSYLVLPAYYATLSTLACSAAGIVVPMLWLRGKIRVRSEDIQRELPLFLDLTNLGTAAGWDVAASMERVIDALHAEFPDHPLFKELRRAKWLTASGYTWNEALDRVGRKLDNDTVRRATLALGQAMKQGGDRTTQLEGIALDAQRSYYADLDKRLAGMPVKVLMLTMGLLVAFFLILLTPAVVQMKASLM